MEKFRNKNLEINPNDFYTIWYETDFHSIYGEAAGANRKKGKKLQIEMKKKYPNRPETLYLLSYIAYKKRDFSKTIQYCRKALEINPNYLPAEKRLEFIHFLATKPILNEIKIINNGNIDEKTIRQFIHVKTGTLLSVEIFEKIKDDLESSSSISGADIYYEIIEDNEVNLNISLETETDNMFFFSSSYELAYNKGNMKSFMENLASVPG
jgi:tetratricopeptide (TPR) repeat protein